MVAFAKIFSDLVTSDVSAVTTWQMGSGSPKFRFGSLAAVHILGAHFGAQTRITYRHPR